MLEFYEPLINLSIPEQYSTMGFFLTLKDPVDGDILKNCLCGIE